MTADVELVGLNPWLLYLLLVKSTPLFMDNDLGFSKN